MKQEKKQKKRGRPPLYHTPEDMQIRIDRYFDSCAASVKTGPDGAPVVIEGKQPTVTALALYLGFSDRSSFRSYKYKPAFADTYKKALGRIEAATEERLFDKDGYRGAVFSLINNFGWSRERIPEQQIKIRVKAPAGTAAGPDPEPTAANVMKDLKENGSFTLSGVGHFHDLG